MLYAESEAGRFLAAVRRFKEQRQRQEKKTQLAKERVKLTLRKLRDSAG